MEAAMLLFLLTVSPVYAMSEVDARTIVRKAAQVQMITLRTRRRALDRRINPFAPIGFYTTSPQINYGNWKDFVLAS